MASAKSEVNSSAQDLFQRGMFWLERQDNEFAVESLLECYRAGINKQEIESIILKDLYFPYQDQYKKNYTHNIELLREYPHIYRSDYPDFDKLNYQFVCCSDTHFVIYDRSKNNFTFDFDLNIKQDLRACTNNEVALLVDEFRIGNMLACEEKTRNPQPYLWSRNPLYLYYRDFNDFVECLQLYNLEPLLASERIVFLFGMDELKQYCSDFQAVLPERLLNVQQNDDEVVKYFLSHNDHMREERIRLLRGIDDYYNNLDRGKLLENIQGGKPRILFITTRFSTALQYSTRDCALACEQLGISTHILIEKSNLHLHSDLSYFEVLHDFKPDIIFQIDHFRWERPQTPDNLVFVTWVQDPLPNVTSRESAARLKSLDFILNTYVTNIHFLLDYGYNQRAIIEGPIGANPYIYKNYSLSETEKEQYRSDICVFSNAGNPELGLNDVIQLIEGSPIAETLAKVFKSAYRDMYGAFYNGEIFYSLNDNIKFIKKYFDENLISAPQESIARIAEQWREQVAFRILRSVPLEWLHEKGYDIKLWGKEWTDHPVLSRYAQGVADNGETLSRIINASKIVLGTNPNISIHPRVFETILSNSFYLGYAIPEKQDWANIRKYLEEDEDIVFAYSREDLYKKIDYYLENEEARVKIFSNAQKKIMEHLTYEALMTRMLKELTDKLS